MFDDEVATANLAIVASNTTSTYFIIQFGSFKPIEVKVPFSPVPIPKDYIFSSLTCYQVSGEEDSSDSEEEIERAIMYRACWSSIIFTNDDRLLGSKIHNRPLFVTGYIREQEVNRILIDGGSVVNIHYKKSSCPSVFFSAFLQTAVIDKPIPALFVSALQSAPIGGL